MTTLYGIKSCDTIRKARKWLDANSVPFIFHDYRTDGLAQAELEGWAKALGWEQLLNKRGTTFRQLPDADKTDIDFDKAIRLMLEHPALIKRPLLSHDGQLHLGFKDDQYQGIFAGAEA
ncbi:ArsC family reductase [Gallaecimonas sp. GXIMD4217]|uniref:ArsC family reductase n=1 Tax=Gallaecimonas sp. GXIMD4217 TaxID=3131927 RepID=UPI00311ABA53